MLAFVLCLKLMMISVLDSFKAAECQRIGLIVGDWSPIIPFPAFSRKGTPSQRSLLICATAVQKVTQRESSGTSSSSLNAGFSPSLDLLYWPIMVLSWSMGGIHSRTRA